MMKMDGRGRAECKNWEKRDIMVILGFVLMRIMPKKGIVLSLTSQKGSKNVLGKGSLTVALDILVLERVCVASL